MEKTILVSKEIHKRFINFKFNKYNDGRHCYLLGRNSNGVIDTMLSLRDDGEGCEWMPSIHASDFNIKMVKLAKRNRVGVGVARIINDLRLQYLRGPVLTELNNMQEGSIFLSYNKQQMLIESRKRYFNKKRHKHCWRRVYHKYAVV